MNGCEDHFVCGDRDGQKLLTGNLRTFNVNVVFCQQIIFGKLVILRQLKRNELNNWTGNIKTWTQGQSRCWKSLLHLVWKFVSNHNSSWLWDDKLTSVFFVIFQFWRVPAKMATCCSPLFSACTGGLGCSQEEPGRRLYRTQNEHLLWLFLMPEIWRWGKACEQD